MFSHFHCLRMYLRQVSDAFLLCCYNDGIGFKTCSNLNLVRSSSILVSCSMFGCRGRACNDCIENGCMSFCIAAFLFHSLSRDSMGALTEHLWKRLCWSFNQTTIKTMFQSVPLEIEYNGYRNRWNGRMRESERERAGARKSLQIVHRIVLFSVVVVFEQPVIWNVDIVMIGLS